jgi:hypothetical protein
MRLISHQMKRRRGRANLPKLCHPTSEKFLLFKGEFRGSA